jgi:hypothetical protein
VEDGTRIPLMQRLRRKGVRVSQLYRLAEVGAEAVELLDTATRERRTVAGATVVLACGLVPDDRLATALTGRVPAVHVIGDALAPRRIMHATLDGARLATAL